MQECEENVKKCEADVQDLTQQLEKIRGVIAKIEKEINESGASMSNLRENIRIRKLGKEIIDMQTEIDSYDMEEAAKARRNFQEKYGAAKDQETELHTAVSQSDADCTQLSDTSQFSHIAGELSSHKSQLKTWEADLKEFKDINKRYTDQLIKVKVRSSFSDRMISILNKADLDIDVGHGQ